MNIAQIEENVKQLLSDVSTGVIPNNDFIFEFMLAYGHRKSSVSRVKSGERNLAKVEGEVRWKRHVYFKQTDEQNLHYIIDGLRKDKAIQRDRIRFVIVTNFNEFLAIDTKTGESLDIPFENIAKHFDFFLPWAGMEKAVYQGENPADVKAAEKMAKLFDLIRADNFDDSNKEDPVALHGLNVFLTRILFCFFAEDTGIFSSNQFSLSVESHTKGDGTDLNSYLDRLFRVLNSAENERADLPEYLSKFPYVNGGLFAENVASPKFSTKSRRMLIECGNELDWSDINPDIFGSMIQAVVHPEQRGNMGMHYTSVTNIMKVIEPLFLNELYEELDNIDDNIDPKLKPSRLRKLKERLTEIKIFDPACGSGNFLIIAYKELRKFEMEVIKRLQEIDDDKHQNQDDLFAEAGLDSSFSEIKLSQFYGIELDDFAHEVAILSMWLAEHQMNTEFRAEFGECAATLPLKSGSNIVCENAVSFDWESFCRPDKSVFILGNPPYLGGKYQSKSQKQDMAYAFKGIKKFGELDYISCWVYKAAKYISSSESSFSFVSTNSINQGSQVHQLWPLIFSLGLEISFAHKPFVWSNNAKSKAAVICVIIGVRCLSRKPKYLFDETHSAQVPNINAYLTTGSDTIVHQSLKPISNLPPILTGNSPYDGGNLILTADEKVDLSSHFPEVEKYLKRLYGSQDFLNGKERWCLWMSEEQYESARTIDAIKARVDSVKMFRESGGEVARGLAKRPYSFRYTHQAKSSLIIIPRVSSQRREYIPFGFLGNDCIVSDSAQAIYDPEPWVFGLLCSKMHMLWVVLTAGRLKSDYRYSSALCYNTFPFPNINEVQKSSITESVKEILMSRENFPEKTLAQLYDPDLMPEELRLAHDNLNIKIESCYNQSGFTNDEERMDELLCMYQKLTGGQNA